MTDPRTPDGPALPEQPDAAAEPAPAVDPAAPAPSGEPAEQPAGAAEDEQTSSFATEPPAEPSDAVTAPAEAPAPAPAEAPASAPAPVEPEQTATLADEEPVHPDPAAPAPAAEPVEPPQADPPVAEPPQADPPVLAAPAPAPAPTDAQAAPAADAGPADPVAQDAAAPAAAGAGDDAASPAAARRAWLPLAALGAVVALLTAGTGYLAWELRQQSRGEQAREEATAAARDAARLLFSYDHTTLEQDFEKGLSVTTGDFREQYQRTTKDVVTPVAEQYDAVVVAEVIEAAIVQASADEVTALVFLNQGTTSTRVQGQQVDQSRVRMQLVRQGGRWLVEGVSAL